MVKIEHPETYDLATGMPKVGGLLDMRLGTNDRNYKCQTCQGTMNECPGHFGHLELARPLFHLGYLSKLKKVLESICFNCARIKADRETLRFHQARSLRDTRARLQQVWSLSKGRMICEVSRDNEEAEGTGHGGCGHRQPIIRREGMRLAITFKMQQTEQDASQARAYLSPEKALSLLKRISDEDALAMGFDPLYSRPEWMILTILPVPPPPVRPSISMDALRSEDDLTYKLADILKANQALRKHEEEGSPAHVIGEFEQLLQVKNTFFFL